MARRSQFASRRQDRFLIAHSIDNRVLDSASVLVDRRARRAKTDRLDAAALLRTLMALDCREAQVCRMVRVPCVEDEDRRRLTRERLLSECNAHLQRVKGLLMLHGVRESIQPKWAQRTKPQALPPPRARV